MDGSETLRNVYGVRRMTKARGGVLMNEIISWKCSKCKVVKNISEFNKNTKCKKGFRSTCRNCDSSVNKMYYSKLDTEEKKRRITHKSVNKDDARKNKLKYKYGITPLEYEEMAITQNYKCAICKKETSKKLCVDHNHITGAIRGLLCHECNIMIGWSKDNPENLIAGANYLKLW